VKHRVVADVGNSAVKVGHFRDDALVGSWRIGFNETAIDERLDLRVEVPERFDSAFCTVVPEVGHHVAEWLKRRGGSRPLCVGPGVRLPFEMAYETPQTLGTDRIAAAAGALAVLGARRNTGRGVVSVDAGTAVTCDVVDESDRFLGGIIAPGPALMNRALNEGTSQLPRVALVAPNRTIGRSTDEALRAGIMLGFVEAVGGFVRRITHELGHSPHVIVTGGWGLLLSKELQTVDAVDPDLVLRGIHAIAGLNER
jgi:type III pantothenate kinase